ncbi:MAG TPA: hypothetical protein VK395_29575 [Gemmataceae bacterium]|nr:hypothetical protein [Gemmataceae bacterium]
MKRKAWKWSLLVSGLLMVVLALVSWWLTHRLTAAERQLVGVWHHREISPQTAPAEALSVLIIAPDHSCRFIGIDTATGQPYRPCMVGRWSLRNGVLSFDWNDSIIAKIRGTLPPWLGGRITFERLGIEFLSADEIVFRHVWSDEWLYIIHRTKEDPVEEMKKPLPNRPWHSSDG